jgi:hypothetical protein
MMCSRAELISGQGTLRCNTRLRIAQHWFEELKRIVAAR